jgi:hypothetical protein
MAVGLTACDTGTGGGGGGGDESVYLTIADITQWNAAVNQIKTGGNGKSYVLTITGTISVPPTESPYFTFGSAGGLTVTLKGDGTLSRDENDYLFNLKGSAASARQTLVIDGPVTLQGSNVVGTGMATVKVGEYAALEMKNGTITSNANRGVDVGGSGSSFTMTGGEISANSAGGVYVNGGSFTLSGTGKISDNTTGGVGGGVYLIASNFTMTGGKISGNTVNSTSYNAYGGGVYVDSGGRFTMTGGEISGNTANSTGADAYGGGVYCFGGITFAKSGGIIYGDEDNTVGNGNDTDNTVESGNGHAVYLADIPKKRDADAGPGVKLYANLGNGLVWTHDGSGVPGIDADTTSEWE